MKPQNRETGRQSHPGGADSHTPRADLKAYLDGELPAWRRWMIQAHLAFCGACREEAAWLKRLGEDMRDLEKATPSPRLRARILASLPATPPAPAYQVIRSAGSGRSRLAAGPRLALGNAMALALVLGVSFAATRGNHAPAKPHPNTAPAITTASSDPPKTGSAPSAPEKSSIETIKLSDPPSAQPDEFNRYADEHAKEWEQRDAQREKTLQKQNRENWKQAMAALQKGKARPGDSAAPVRLTLMVPDVSEAQKRLSAWANEVGGSASDSEETKPNNGAATPTPSAAGSGPGKGVFSGTVDTSDAVTVAVLKVPAHRAVELQPLLQQIGILKAPTGPSSEFHPTLPKGPKSTPVVSNEGDKNGEKSLTPKPLIEEPGGTDSADTHLPAPTPPTGITSAPRPNQKPMVTILVRLQTMKLSPQ